MNLCLLCGRTAFAKLCRRCKRLRSLTCAECGKPSARRVCGECARTWADSVLPGNCQVCETALRSHTRCRACGILAGPGHVVTALEINGKCTSCNEYAAARLAMPVEEYEFDEAA